MFFHRLILLTLLLTPLARGEFPTTHPYQPIEYHHELRADPIQSIYIITVDLTDPRVSIRVAPGGADPDGAGPWQTTLLPVRDIAAREHFDIAVNASFFAINRSNIAEEKAEASGKAATTLSSKNIGYVAGDWARSIGWTMSDGKLLSTTSNNWPIFYISADGVAKIDQPEKIPTDVRQIVAGNCLLLKNGQPAGPFTGAMAVRHPRTAIGLNRDNTKLILLTVDGRRPLSAWGMTAAEMVDEFQKLNCWTAMNLDGGGSTTLIMRDPQTSELKVLNNPSDNRQRPVSDAIGITIHADNAK
jgi:exopolysaccharide biosynthesis protein